jgi:WD40 repeat protein
MGKLSLLQYATPSNCGIWRRKRNYYPHGIVIGSIALLQPDGKTLASASWDKTIKCGIWRRKRNYYLNGHSDTSFSVTFSPMGKLSLPQVLTRPSNCGIWRRKKKLLPSMGM